MKEKLKKDKKYIICALLSLLLIGCGNTKTEELTSLINLENVATAVNVEHYSAAGEENYSLTEPQIEELSEWIGTTSLEKVTFSEEEEPSNLNGTNCYIFSSESFVGFDLYDVGEGGYYVQIEDAWYRVVE